MVPAHRPDASNIAAASTLATPARLDASSSFMPVTTDTSPSPKVVTSNNNSSSSQTNKQEVGSSSSKPISGNTSSQENSLPQPSRCNAALSQPPTFTAAPVDALNRDPASAPRPTPFSEQLIDQQLEQPKYPLALSPDAKLVESHTPLNGDADAGEEDNDIASDIQERSLGENDDLGSLQEQDDANANRIAADDQLDHMGSAVAAAHEQQQQGQQQHRQQQPSSSGEVQTAATGEVSLGDMEQQDDLGEDTYPQESYTSPHHEWARILQRRLNKGLTDAQLLARSNSMLASPSILAQSLTKAIPRLHSKDGQQGTQDRPHQTAEELFDRPAPLDPSPVHYHESSRRDEAFPSTLDALGSTSNLLLFAPLDPEQLYGKTSTSTPAPPPPPPPSAPTQTADPPAAAPAKVHPAGYTSKEPTLPNLAPAPPASLAKAMPAVDATLIPPQPTVPSNQQRTATASSTHHTTAPTNNNQVDQDTPGGPLPMASTVAVPAVQVIPTESSAPQPAALVSNVFGATGALGLSQSPETFTKSPVMTQTMAASTSTTAAGVAGVAGVTGAGTFPPIKTPVPVHPVNYPTSYLTYTPQTHSSGGQHSSEKKPFDARDDNPSDLAATGLTPSTLTRPRAGSESLVSSQDTAVKDWALQTLSGFAEVNVDVSLSIGQPALQAPSQAPTKSSAPNVAKVIQSPFESDPIELERPPIVFRANSYPIERSSSIRHQSKPPTASTSQTTQGSQPPAMENTNREQTPADSSGSSPGDGRISALGQAPGQQVPVPALGHGPSRASMIIQPGSAALPPTSQVPLMPTSSAAMPTVLPQSLYQQGPAFPHSAPYTLVPVSASLPAIAPSLVVAPPVAPVSTATAPTTFVQNHRPEHRVGGSVSSLREVNSQTQATTASTERTSIDNKSGSHRPDVNLIDVPALAGKQLLPLEPRPLPPLPESQKCFQFGHIAKAIRFWGRARSDASAFAVMDGKGITWGSWTWGHILGRAEMIAKNILEQTQLKPGARVILIYRLAEVLDFVAALYGSFLAGVVPVLVNQTHELSEINYIFAATRTELVLTTEQTYKVLHQGMNSKRGASWPRTVTWWKTDGMGTWAPKDKKEKRPSIRAHELALIEYTKSASGELKGVATSHRSLLSQCRTLLQSFAYRVPATNQAAEGNNAESSPLSPVSPVDSATGTTSSRSAVPPETLDQCVVASWLESRQQVGLWLTSIMGAFCGNFTIFMDSSITSHPNIYVGALGALQVNIAFGDYQGMRTLLGNLRSNPQAVFGGNPPSLAKLRAFYAHTQTCQPRLNIEFLEELLGPLGMCQHSFKSSQSVDRAIEDKTTTGSGSNKDDMEEGKSTPPAPQAPTSEEMALPRGVIAFVSLPEHGGPVIGLRDELGPPKGIEAFDLRKRYRKSSFPLPRSSLAGSTTGEPLAVKLKSSSISSMTQCVYLLHRGALRRNRVVVLATGQDALRRADEPGTMLVGGVGYPIAKSTILIVDPETTALSLPDEVGEIWFSSTGMPAGYWNLSEHTKEVFHAEPLIVNEETMVPEVYRAPGCDKMLRTGLLGTLIEGRLVIFGTYDERLKQDAGDPMKPRGLEFEFHHSSDIAHTLRTRVRNTGELCIFSCLVNKEYLPVICIEMAKDPSCTNPSARAKTIARTVVDVLTEVNGLRSYCVAVWEPNELPRVLSNGRRVLDLAVTKRLFELGRIPHMLHLITFTDGVVLNLPQGDDPVAGVWSRDCIAKRQQRMGVPAQHWQHASNISIEDPMDERMDMSLNKFHNITDILMWRTIVQPDDAAYIEVDYRGRDHKVISFKKLNHKVTGVATYLEKKHQLKAGDHVILWFCSAMDLIVTLHACWVMGVIPIPLPAPGFWASTLVMHAQAASVTNLVNLTATTHALTSGGSAANLQVGNAIEEERTAALQALLHIMDEVKIKAIIGNSHSEDVFKSKAFATQLRAARPQTPTLMTASGDALLVPFVNISKAGKTNKTLGLISGFIPRKEWLGPTHPATILYDLHARPESSSYRRLLKLSHEGMTALARNHKQQSKMTSGEPILGCLSAFSGPGFVQACLAGVYNGSPTLLIHPGDFLATPTIWMEVIAKHNVQHASLTYPMAEQLLSRIDNATTFNPAYSLESLKNLMIYFDGRAMRDLNTSISTRLAAFKFSPSAISMTYGTPLDIMASSRAGTGIGPVRLHVSTRLLRHGIIQTTSEGDDPTGMWLEDSGSVGAWHTIAIVHPETFEICPINQVGEIWICADSTVNQFYGHSVQAAINAGNYSYLPFNACANYDQRVRYVRTGDLGFLWDSQLYHLQQQQQGLQPQGISGHHHHHLQQLFVLGSMSSSFQVNGLLHFASDIEATVESAHANVAAQGCVTFKTKMGHVVVVVKVVHQEMERLLPMYIPLMHAIMEQHQFVPDVIALVGDDVTTARGPLDACKPRKHLQALYQASKLPTLHEHYCHGRWANHPAQQQGGSTDSATKLQQHFDIPVGQHVSAASDDIAQFSQQGVHHTSSEGGVIPPPVSQVAVAGNVITASPHLTSAVLLAPAAGPHHQYPAHTSGATMLPAATVVGLAAVPATILYTPTGRPTSLILPSTIQPVNSAAVGPSSAGAIPMSSAAASGLHAHYPSAPGGNGGIHPLHLVHGSTPPHSHPRSMTPSGRTGSLEDFGRIHGNSQYTFHQQFQPNANGSVPSNNNNNASGDINSSHSQKNSQNGQHDNKKGSATVMNLVKGMNARLTEMRKASLT
ncbi:hypothetical protein BGW41_002088 [Actinomortierella wolfii]|nr:hypothetical protein BGW41_002088 [Actinomortierella wolfii]